MIFHLLSPRHRLCHLLQTNQTTAVYLGSQFLNVWIVRERIFNDEQALFHHINTDHEGVKYDYNQCDKKFIQLITLTRHIHSIHEGVKYPCDQGGKQYTGQ